MKDDEGKVWVGDETLHEGRRGEGERTGRMTRRRMRDDEGKVKEEGNETLHE